MHFHIQHQSGEPIKNQQNLEKNQGYLVEQVCNINFYCFVVDKGSGWKEHKTHERIYNMER